MSKKLVIIDGKSIFYRGYYAMPGLSTKEGTPTGGVYGFTVLALEVLKRLKPDYACVAWDKSGTNIRSRLKIYPEYKAGRKKAPPDFYEQIPVLHDLLEAFSWPMYELDDYEADDIMATLAIKAEAEDIETILVSSDLDLLQAVSPKTKMYALKKGLSNIVDFTPEAFEKKYGIKVDQFVDYKSIKGDSSDNIPGVKGIGEKGALNLLTEYKTLDGVYENLDSIKGATQSKLRDSKDMAYLSKELVKLFTDAPIDLDLKALNVKDYDAVKLRSMLRKLEFGSLLNKLPANMQGEDEPEVVLNAAVNLELPKVIQHTNLKDLAKIVKADEPVMIDSYCTNRLGRGLQALSVSVNPKELHLFDLRTLDGQAKDVDLKIKVLNIFGYDVKGSMQMLVRQGINEVKAVDDIHIADFLLDPLKREHTFSSVCMTRLGVNTEFENLNPEDYLAKAAEKTACMWKLQSELSERFKKFKKLEDLYKAIELPTVEVLARLELIGMKLDAPYLNKMGVVLEDQISDIIQTIYGYADQEFNISSPSQLSEILFEKLNLPTVGIKKTKSAYSTAASELAKLRSHHEIIDCISTYREHTKLKSTYVDTLPDHQDEDGRVRSSLSQTVAATGRLSSSDPNLQNIPVRTELGKQIRKAFIADEGNVLISADYSQFELRLAAVLANDEDMVEAFNSDIDIHTLTASQVYGVALEDVTSEMRYSAKAVNFGILYGQGTHGLAQQTGMSYADAKDFIESYFNKRSALRDYIKDLRLKAKDDGYVETFFGRRRPTPDVQSSNFVVRESAYRQAVNMPIQGTEADLMKKAMIVLDEELDKAYGPWTLNKTDRPMQIMQVHDSIIVECKESQAIEAAQIMTKIMEGIAPEITIKLKVDSTIGKTWGDL